MILYNAMMLNKSYLLSVVLLLVSAIGVSAYESPWQKVYDQTLLDAQKEGKLILLVVTGSLWDENSMILRGKILSDDSFREAVDEHFVYLNIDVRVRELEKEMAHYDSVLYPYGPEILPKMMFCDQQGRPFSAFGFMFDDGENVRIDPFIKVVNEAKSTLIKQEKSLASANNLEGKEAAQALLNSLGPTMRHEPILLTRFYPETLIDIITVYPKAEPFLTNNYLLSEKMAEFLETLPKEHSANKTELIDKKINDNLTTLYDKQFLCHKKAFLYADEINDKIRAYDDEHLDELMKLGIACIEQGEAYDPLNGYFEDKFSKSELRGLYAHLARLAESNAARSERWHIDQAKRKAELEKISADKKRVEKFRFRDLGFDMDEVSIDIWGNVNSGIRKYNRYAEKIIDANKRDLADFEKLLESVGGKLENANGMTSYEKMPVKHVHKELSILFDELYKRRDDRTKFLNRLYAEHELNAAR